MQVSGLQAPAGTQQPNAAILFSQFSDDLAALLARVRALANAHSRTASPILAVALSGGADSMALTLLAQRWASVHGARIVALTVDHRLREESTQEAHQVAAWMNARGMAHHILTPAHTPASRNLQEAARQWRYDALTGYCHAHGIPYLLVAHTASDNRETVAHALARGDTADGASGMARLRQQRGIQLLRPLLDIEREPLEHFLCAEHAPWVEDPSNRNRRFARVRLREALQSDPARAAELDAIIARARAERHAREQEVREAAANCVLPSPLGFAELDLAIWRTLAPTLASQLLADCLRAIDGGPHRPRGADTARLIEALHTNAPLRRTLHRCKVTRTGDTLRIARELARVAAPMPLSGHGQCRWDDRFEITYQSASNLTLRALGRDGVRQWQATMKHPLPLSTPSLWHLDECVALPHINGNTEPATGVRLAFAPAKPLDAPPFW